MSQIAPIVLAPGWFEEIIIPGVDPMQPGLYEWWIEDVGYYIGQYTRATRPRRAYSRNITNLLNRRPYRKGKPDKFRPAHRALAEAVSKPRRVRLTFLENVADKSSRNRREREVIADRRRAVAQCGLVVLNPTRDITSPGLTYHG